MKRWMFLYCGILAGCMSRPGWGYPATFIGRPERIRDEVYVTVNGREHSYVVKVVAVKEGQFNRSEVGFEFAEGLAPPLELGQFYLFTYQADRHGGHYTQVEKWSDASPPARR